MSPRDPVLSSPKRNIMQVYEATFIMMIERQRDAVKLKKFFLNTVWQEMSRVKRSRFAWVVSRGLGVDLMLA